MSIKRIEREKQTVNMMIKMYCSHHHNEKNDPLCSECSELRNFADERIDKCVFHDEKPVCAQCQVHCYRKDYRENIKTVMRFAGPRMIFHHPILGILHLIDKRRFKYTDPKVFRSLKRNL